MADLKLGTASPFFAVMWHDAESAPKSGEHILVTQRGMGGFGNSGGGMQDWHAVVHYWPVAGEEGFYLSSGASDPIDDRPMQFTHWMRLGNEDATRLYLPAAATGDSTNG